MRDFMLTKEAVSSITQISCQGCNSTSNKVYDYMEKNNIGFFVCSECMPIYKMVELTNEILDKIK